MRFPGNRIARHYFPVTDRATRVVAPEEDATPRWYIVGLDEVLVDIEVHGPADLAREHGLLPGESVHLSPPAYRALLERFASGDLHRSYAAGGTVANTLNNYTYLSGEPALLLGAIPPSMTVGSPAFAYVAQTPKAVGLEHLVTIEGEIGTTVTFISPDGDRSFGVAPGVAGDYPAKAIPEAVVRGAAVVVTSLYALGQPDRPIAAAARRLMRLARDAGAPVAFGLGTANLVRRLRDEVRALLEEYVTVAAMNIHEAEALTGEPDALLACRRLLDWVDLAIVTEGPRGLTLAGWTDEGVRRATGYEIRSKSIPEYNRWEFSRVLRRADCERPLRVYSHIHPYRGGPDRLHNASGAGDAALAAVLHDVAANRYHRTLVPSSDKHHAPFLTYSSLSRNAQYANRVAYEVLKGRSPRLDGPVGHDDEADSASTPPVPADEG